MCFLKLVSNYPTDLPNGYYQLLQTLGVNSLMEEIESIERDGILTELTSMTGCQRRNPENVPFESSQLGNVSANTTHPVNLQVKCFEFTTDKLVNIVQTPNSIFSALPNLEFLKIKKKLALQDLDKVSHSNIKYLLVNNIEDINDDKFIDYKVWNEKVILDWSGFNMSLDENLWESFTRNEKHGKKYDSLVSSNNKSIDKIINIHLPNLEILELSRVIFNKNNSNLVISTTSTNLTHLLLENCEQISDFNHHFVNMKNLTLLQLYNCNLTSYKSSPNQKTIKSLILFFNFFLGLHSDSSLNLQHHPNLEVLQIVYCHVYRFPKDTLKFNRKLRHLDMSRNFLTVLYNDTFKSNTALELLDLSWNQFAKMPKLNIGSLKKFYMNYNKIEELKEDSLSALENLQILILNNNKIRYVHSNCFGKLKNLQVLSLSDNELNKFTYQLPMNLKYQFVKKELYYSEEEMIERYPVKWK